MELCSQPQQGAVGRAISCTPLEVGPLVRCIGKLTAGGLCCCLQQFSTCFVAKPKPEVSGLCVPVPSSSPRPKLVGRKTEATGAFRCSDTQLLSRRWSWGCIHLELLSRTCAPHAAAPTWPAPMSMCWPRSLPTHKLLDRAPAAGQLCVQSRTADTISPGCLPQHKGRTKHLPPEGCNVIFVHSEQSRRPRHALYSPSARRRYIHVKVRGKECTVQMLAEDISVFQICRDGFLFLPSLSLCLFFSPLNLSDFTGASSTIKHPCCARAHTCLPPAGDEGDAAGRGQRSRRIHVHISNPKLSISLQMRYQEKWAVI